MKNYSNKLLEIKRVNHKSIIEKINILDLYWNWVAVIKNF